MTTDDTFGFEPEVYRADLAELALTRQQEDELLGILWSIMRSFVEMGFDVEGCGQLLEVFEQAAALDSDVVPSPVINSSEATAQRENSY